jgi:hypothetical protein
MKLAVCINCGAMNRHPMDGCNDCGFEPRTDEEKARSLMLSTDYEIGGEYRGKTTTELEVIAADIRRGQRHEFDAKEIRSVLKHAHHVAAIPARRLIVDGL